MVWIIFFSLLLFLFTLFLILITTLKVNIAFSYRFELTVVHKLDIFLSVMNILLWKKSIDLPRLEGTTESGKNHALPEVDWKKIIPFIKKIEVRELEWETGIGTGEAHITGMISGWLWACQELAVKVVEQYCTVLSKPIVAVESYYQGEGLYSRLDCIFRLRIHTFLKIYRIINDQK
ncbi:DUF2953 domain-containing protein [Oceanobacillus alkalisoli]|uniref:DUF2953 domain-containing protein n=1 Tax=Oceanobacillus alkalisoli TaxID=2925113 RepID=UPI001EE3E831|nr:DUF2953 domain-containing protein [Oceanobacillus alkalisoli]MCG5103792.1 DUF2953 domain-containing protein [Oceanobacillus alkalisoli]